MNSFFYYCHFAAHCKLQFDASHGTLFSVIVYVVPFLILVKVGFLNLII